jgi:hypothetical protein
MKTKEELLKELRELGINKATGKVRQPRSDLGQTRNEYKPRADRGKSRGSYINTAAKYKAIYDKMLTAHKVVGAEDGADTFTRDQNDIFPPNLNRYYKLIRSKDRVYYTSALKPAHLEQARWRWLMAEYAENPEQWAEHISKWYFIRKDEINDWMYTEWAWAYINHIRGVENRLTNNPLVLIYADYMNGQYNGHPKFDERGDIVWPRGE